MINHQTPAPTRPRSAEGLTAYALCADVTIDLDTTDRTPWCAGIPTVGPLELSGYA